MKGDKGDTGLNGLPVTKLHLTINKFLTLYH